MSNLGIVGSDLSVSSLPNIRAGEDSAVYVNRLTPMEREAWRATKYQLGLDDEELFDGLLNGQQQERNAQ